MCLLSYNNLTFIVFIIIGLGLGPSTEPRVPKLYVSTISRFVKFYYDNFHYVSGVFPAIWKTLFIGFPELNVW